MDKTISVPENKAGIRIDVFLAKDFFSLSRGDIAKNIKNGKILVNGIQIKPSYKLKEGDEITLNLSLERTKLLPNPEIKIQILHEDDDVIIIEKPTGIQVHPSSMEKEKTIVNGLLAKFPEIKDVHDDSLGSFLRPGIVHRLDKETSGLMVVARNMQSLNELKKMFEEREVSKKYTALVLGHPKNKKGVITKPIARSSNYRKQVITGEKTKTKSRGAVTKYKELKKIGNYSLVEAIPLTGRMHQIRIHFFSIDHPVAGDKKYGLRIAKKWQGPIPERQLLHASEITFKLFGKKYAFSSPLPYDFLEFIKNIEN